MGIADVPYSLLVTGAGLVASGAATEFAKGASRLRSIENSFAANARRPS